MPAVERASWPHGRWGDTSVLCDHQCTLLCLLYFLQSRPDRQAVGPRPGVADRGRRRAPAWPTEQSWKVQSQDVQKPTGELARLSPNPVAQKQGVPLPAQWALFPGCESGSTLYWTEWAFRAGGWGSKQALCPSASHPFPSLAPSRELARASGGSSSEHMAGEARVVSLEWLPGYKIPN